MTLTDLKQQLLSLLTSNEQVGVFVSGGLDSGLLLYLCCLIKKENNLSTKIHIFTVTDPDPDNICNEVPDTKNLVEWINKIFDLSLKITMVGNPYEHHSKRVWSGILSVRHLRMPVLLGDMLAPPHMINDLGAPVTKKSPLPEVIQPFINVTKKEVVALIIELNLIELIKISICLRIIENPDAYCWSCREKDWAFKENNFDIRELYN